MEQINLNLIPNGIPAVCHVSQYDNTGRKIRFRLFNGSDPYVLSDTETISLHIRKSNGEVLIFDIANTSSDYIDLEIASEMSDVSGESICKFYIENSNINIGSFNFKMRVEPDAFDGKITTSEARGPIASFETNIEDNLIKLKTEINPVQDLHGYSKPWIGGAGKNLIDLSNKSVSEYGYIYNKEPIFLKSGTYTFSFNISANGGQTLVFRKDNTELFRHNFSATIGRNSVSFTISDDANSISLYSGVSGNFTNFQIEKGSQATSWEPYSNICPISGFNALNVTRTGKNLFSYDLTIRDGYWTNNAFVGTNAIVPKESAVTWQYIRVYVEGLSSITLSGFDNQGGTNCAWLSSENVNDVISKFNSLNKNGTKTVPSGAKYLCLTIFNIKDKSTIYPNAQLELGNQATDFEPYKGSKYQEYFSGLANGTYGYVDLGTLNWISEDNVVLGLARVSDVQVTPLGAKYSQIPICTQYEGVSPKGYPDFNNGEVGFSNGEQRPFIRARSTDFIGKTNAEIKALMSGVYLIYELASATTPTITQSEIDTLITAFNADLVTVIFGQTVYGGQVDVTNGKVTVTHGYIDLSLTPTANIKQYPYRGMNGVYFDNVLPETLNEAIGLSNCSDKVGHHYDSNSMWVGVNNKNVYWIGILDELSISLADFKTWIANNKVELVYELATPIEITTTPENLSALSGQNNVYSDTNGDTEVKYYIEV